MANWMYPDYEYEGDEEDGEEYADYYEAYDYADLDPNDPEARQYIDEDDGNTGMADISYSDLQNYCIGPTIGSTVPHLSLLLAWVLIFTVTVRIVKLPNFIKHLLSISSGSCVLYQVFGVKSLYLIGQILSCMCATPLSLLILAPKKSVWVVSTVCISYLLVCELWLVEGTVWHSIRGAQMIVLMKIISYVNDKYDPYEKKKEVNNKTNDTHDKEASDEKKDNKNSYQGGCKTEDVRNRNHKTKTEEKVQNVDSKKNSATVAESQSKLYDLIEFLGYMLHPGTIIFGPWCSLKSYRQILEPMKWSIWWAAGIILNLALSCLFLVCSTCLITWIIPDNSNRWIIAYRDAASFRLSHYFVSHFSEASASLGGVEIGVVSRAQHVELPRSLLSVVTYWNIPMHNFLKKYVFIKVRAVSGVWLAVLSTYSASAVIHGLNGQLCAVLISLAVYTHAEHCLRTKLSKAFDACVLAKACKQPCDEHKNTAYSSSALLINTLMGLLCVWHLAYLGVMFDSTPSSAKGYSISHTLSKWSELQFASHWAVLGTYLVTALI